MFFVGRRLLNDGVVQEPIGLHRSVLPVEKGVTLSFLSLPWTKRQKDKDKEEDKKDKMRQKGTRRGKKDKDKKYIKDK